MPKKTKSPAISKRNKAIQKEYCRLLRHGYQAKRAKEMLAEKYYLAYSTIENIIYRENSNHE